jgi:hypothetical protein
MLQLLSDKKLRVTVWQLAMSLAGDYAVQNMLILHLHLVAMPGLIVHRFCKLICVKACGLTKLRHNCNTTRSIELQERDPEWVSMTWRNTEKHVTVRITESCT